MSNRRPSLRNRITTSLGGNIKQTKRVENAPQENLGADIAESRDTNYIEQEDGLLRSGSTGKIFSDLQKPSQNNNVSFGIGAEKPAVEEIDAIESSDDNCIPCSRDNQFFDCGCKVCLCDDQDNCAYQNRADSDPCKKCTNGEIIDLNELYAPCSQCVNGQIIPADPPAGFNKCSSCWTPGGWRDTCLEKSKYLPKDITWKYECRQNNDDPNANGIYECLPPKDLKCPKPPDPCKECVLTGRPYPDYYKFVPICDLRESRCVVRPDGRGECVCKQKSRAEGGSGGCPPEKPSVDQSTCECICEPRKCYGAKQFVSNNEVCGCYCDKYEAYGLPEYSGQTKCPENHRVNGKCECECALSERSCRRYKGLNWGFNEEACECFCDITCSEGYTKDLKRCRCNCELNDSICKSRGGLVFREFIVVEGRRENVCGCYHPYYDHGGTKQFGAQQECPAFSKAGFVNSVAACVSAPLPSVNLSATFTANEGSQDGTITVTWDDIDDPRITGYDTTVEDLGILQNLNRTEMVVALGQFTFDATAGHSYKVGVAAVTAAGKGEYSYTTVTAGEDYSQSLFNVKFVP